MFRCVVQPVGGPAKLGALDRTPASDCLDAMIGIIPFRMNTPVYKR